MKVKRSEFSVCVPISIEDDLQNTKRNEKEEKRPFVTFHFGSPEDKASTDMTSDTLEKLMAALDTIQLEVDRLLNIP